ncbi:intracellular proteinase inhibitor (BsuPI) [Sediminibacillus dalangtanensis]|uniref:Intracellular proteinase inhibitor (BsuPI) n=1 Tax=Sediminibacillus dalangtanensis TaxID=2729421 RepID=A0ABX7VX04_9BACI|nr:BsuPI-related putative proteinase inhibitor [Sediminibacillus dalangtanensis]QTM99131.1 intracellular proteinase inhibitor (BsuPI) [Sediminibacillus dalangtanensis]
MKRAFLFLLLAAAILAGCGSNNQDEEAEEVNGNDDGSLNQVNAELMEQSPLVYQYSVSNNSDEKIKLEFTSSQRYDYEITNDAGEQVFLFSSVTSFAQVMGEETLHPGDTLDYQIDLRERDMEPGDYLLTAWLTPSGGEKYKAEQSFTIPGEE